jgi:Concanavalin A-like lectin/glucanases superfamily/Secretion system C-terminal sorting domain
MKKILLFNFVFILSAFANAQTPVAYYPFNGNANDAAGTLNGTVNGATLTTDRFGNANSAYSFDGVDDFIGTTGLAISQNQNWTISAWVKAASLSQAGTFIVLNGFSTASAGNGYAMTVLNADNTGAGNVFKLHYPGQVLVNSGFTFSNINTWHYVVITRDINAIGKMYFDGILSATTTTASINPTGGDFRIGSATNNGFWDGAIDEVKVYNNALTDAQVQAEYAATSQMPKPGSGNAISFDGVDDVVVNPHSSVINFGANNDFTIDFWLKLPANQTNLTFVDNMIIDKWIQSVSDPYPFSIRYCNSTHPSLNGQIQFTRYDGTNISYIASSSSFNDDKWHYVTCVKSGSNLFIYKDGILANAATDIVTGSTTNNYNLHFGARGTTANFLNGSLDEVRIWNTALTQSQIRDHMCRKITSTDALYPNLVAYYNFDESTGATAFDGTINNNNGILINSPARVTSGAAIGNASSHDYVNAIKTTTLSHTTGESLTVTSTAGSPDGIQVYRVDGQPNTLSGATGVGSNDKYFGVFQAGGTAPQYTAVYNYSGNLGVNIGNEFQLRLNKRTDNAATTWSILPDVANEAANTITVTGQSTEYILGKVGVPLPVSILSFTGTLKNQTVLLQWKVTEEINTVQFVIERSNGSNAFTTIGTKQPLNAGNTGYTLTDNAPFANGAVQYYRLKIIDKNGGYKYSNIIRISSQSTNQPVIIFPNPVKDVITISGLKQTGTIKIISADGKMMQQQIVTAQTITLDLSNYAKGIYLLQYLVKGEVLSQKIIKQ